MTKIAFRCPYTGVNVERLIDEDSAVAPDEFWPVRCPACGKTHFVNRTSQKLLGYDAAR